MGREAGQGAVERILTLGFTGFEDGTGDRKQGIQTRKTTKKGLDTSIQGSLYFHLDR